MTSLQLETPLQRPRMPSKRRQAASGDRQLPAPAPTGAAFNRTTAFSNCSYQLLHAACQTLHPPSSRGAFPLAGTPLSSSGQLEAVGRRTGREAAAPLQVAGAAVHQRGH